MRTIYGILDIILNSNISTFKLHVNIFLATLLYIHCL